VALLVAALAGAACGDSDEPSGAPPETVAKPAARLQVTSPAFTEGGAIPVEFTCDGANRSPPLAWAGVPAGTASLALRMQDIDTSQKFVHWLVYNITPTTTSLAAGQTPPDSIQAPNSFDKPGYGGPCPPAGSRHRYVFTLIALETQLTVSTDTRPEELWATLEQSSVTAKGELTGTYERR
jgi:Raf kinase inhibitor-like YbhB/YbcL family protein